MTTIYRGKKPPNCIKKESNRSKMGSKSKVKRPRQKSCDLRNVALRTQRQILKSSLSGEINLNNAFAISPSQSK